MFEHLKSLEARGDRESTYRLYQLAGAPRLHLLHAGESNRPYYAEYLKLAAQWARMSRAIGLTPERVKEQRDADRDLYPRFVIKGWEGIKDGDGRDVPFSPEACRKLLDALPDWIFDEVRDYASNEANFAAGLNPSGLAGN